MSNKLKRRLLVISFSYSRPIKRDKLFYLANYYDVLLIHPASFPEKFILGAANPIKVITVSHCFLFSIKPNTGRVLMQLPIRAIRTFNPDYIYVDAEPWLPTLWYLLFLKAIKLVRGKIAVHCLTNQIIDKWQGLFRSYIYCLVARQVTAIIGSSSQVTETNRTLCRRDSLTYDTIPHIGPPSQEFNPKHKIPLGDTFVFGYLGRISEEKGLEYLIDAFRLLPGNVYDKSVLHIYGKGHYLSFLKNIAGNDAKIVFKGYVDPDDVPTTLGKMHVFILPSIVTKKDCEQWPIAIVEAMLTGIPIIATNVGGIPELLNGFGYLVPEKNAERLSNAMVEIFKTYHAYPASLALRGREFAVKHYSGRALAERLTHFLSSLDN